MYCILPSLLYSKPTTAESQKPRRRVGNADRKVFARPERLDLHDVAKDHHCHSTKGQIVLEDLLGKSVVNLVQHFCLDQADLIYYDQFEILQISSHLVSCLIWGRHDVVIELEVED